MISLAETPVSDTALEVRDLCKTFNTPAVDRLELTVASGELYALLGPNGAGKTTTLRIVAGLLRPDRGTVKVFGIDALKDPVASKRIVAWLPDDPMLYDKLNPLEYLAFIAGLWGIGSALARQSASELLEQLDLWPYRFGRCETFSRGMKQKVALAGALIHDPRLLILDEPLTGLDAASARKVKDILTARVSAGSTVILTTHILEVAERLADRIGIIRQGRLLAEGTMTELAALAGESNATGTGTSGGMLEHVFLHLTGTPAQAA